MLLLKGNQGNEVHSLQVDLIELGFGVFLGKWGADRKYGQATEKAVKKFQDYAGIKVDGKAGNETFGAITRNKNMAGAIGTYNFNIEEFHSKDGGGMRAGGMSDQLLLKLELLRYQCGSNPVSIESGYRTISHNKNVGGVKNSQHLYGKAADIKVRGVTANKVYEIADKIFSNGGVGKYQTFTHVDTRGHRSRF